MAVTMMIAESRVMGGGEYNGNVTVVTDYRGHEAGRVVHASTCPHHADHFDLSGALRADCVREWGRGGRCEVFGPLYMETRFTGLVLETGEVNGRDDSDFFAVVWDAQKGEPFRVEYASTRGWTYPNHATVDATPEVRAAYDAYREARMAAARAAAIAAEAAREAAALRRGRVVRVVRGRKVPKGTVGRIFWTGASAYGERVGIEIDGGERVFTAATNVEVIAA